MAAKKTVYLNKPGRVREVRQHTIDELKEAFKLVMKDYLRMKEQQSRFEDSLEKFCLKISPWSIPHREVASWLKGIR